MPPVENSVLLSPLPTPGLHVCLACLNQYPDPPLFAMAGIQQDVEQEKDCHNQWRGLLQDMDNKLNFRARTAACSICM